MCVTHSFVTAEDRQKGVWYKKSKREQRDHCVSLWQVHAQNNGSWNKTAQCLLNHNSVGSTGGSNGEEQFEAIQTINTSPLRNS